MDRAGGRSDVSGTGSLEIDEDVKFQRRSWAVQRAGWAVMAALVVAALLGFFSGGMLSRATAAAPSGAVAIQYDRFLRYDAPASLRIRLGQAAVRDGLVELRIGAALAEMAKIERIMPEPETAATIAEGILMRFPVGHASPPGTVRIEIRPARPGMLNGSIGVADGETVRFSQFVYP